MSAHNKLLPPDAQLSPGADVVVNVVGDTHGQFHDVLHLLELAGEPSPTNWYVFNGGAWNVRRIFWGGWV